MRRAAFFFVVFAVSLAAGVHKENKNKTPEDLDAVYAAFQKILPTGWTLDSSANIFLFTRKDSITYSPYFFNTWNQVNFPTSKLKFQYRVEVHPLWSENHRKKTIEHNDAIKLQIDSLRRQCVEAGLPFAMDEPYGRNETETMTVINYHHKKDSLAALYKPFPEISSKKHSVIIINNLPCFGCKPSAEISNEISELRNKIKAIFTES